MTSIEWLKNNYENSHILTDRDFRMAIDMHKQEMAQLPKQEEEVIVIDEISDNEILQQADKVWIYTLNEDFMKGFESGAKWYRNQLKNN